MLKLSERHRPSGVNTNFNACGLTFAQYIQRTASQLLQVHNSKHEFEKLVAGNAPFELHPLGEVQRSRTKPYKRGVLLTHGLSDSPYHMRYLATFFQAKGFRVMVILLPGHGTQPGDLLDVPWQEWAKAVAYGADCLADEVDELYLAGYSAGAALSVLHAKQDDRVRGLFLFAPALEITARAAWARLHSLYSWLIPQGAWVNVRCDHDLYKYESFCMNAVTQMYGLIQALPQTSVSIPVFAVASADDATVNADATMRFMQREQHPHRKLVWYATEKVEHTNLEWVLSAVPAQRILSSAHTAIMLPPEDPHYGVNGSYKNLLHYEPDEIAKFEAGHSNLQEMWLGEITAHNLAYGPLRRLTFNPHFDAMTVSMSQFIAGLP